MVMLVNRFTMATKMMMAVTTLLMTFYVSQFSSLPIDDEEAAILAELKNAPLEDADLQEMFEESSELSPRFGVNDVLKTLEEKCQCEDLACFCCGTPKIAGIAFNACVNMTMYPSAKVIGIGAGVGENSVHRNISVGRMRRMCNSLPGFLNKFKVCMFNTWNEGVNERAMTACTSLEIDYSDTSVASIQFHCLELKNGQVSFAIPEDAEGRSAIMSLKIKNPLKSLVSWFKKKFYGDN